MVKIKNVKVNKAIKAMSTSQIVRSTRSKKNLKDKIPLLDRSSSQEFPHQEPNNQEDTIAIDKTMQRKVSRHTKKIKKGLEDGSITLKSSFKDMKQKAEEKRGLVYIGHIPHGFYEKEMRNYFKQFGKVTNVKVCRSNVSGNSKGYGYVEFSHPEVAKIAADSMNNYLMFKKRIVTEYVPYEKRPKGLFHGKSSSLENTSTQSRRGKQKHSRNKTKDTKTVVRKAKSTVKKLQSKMAKLKNLGIQCDLIPVDVNEKILKVKTEKKSTINTRSSKHFSMSDSSSKNSSNRSLPIVKSNKAMLTKSLDSVRKLMTKSSINSQDQETQTPDLKAVKKERRVLRGGVTKKEKEKNKLLANLDRNTIQRIARELIRKQGTPKLNLKKTKPKAGAKN